MKKKILVGVFVVGGVLLFGVGLFIIGSRNQMFASHFSVYTGFNSVDTLQTGAKVRVSGMDAGQVTAIDIPKSPGDKFRFKLQVDEKFHALVRQDSLVTIETSGMVGNQYVNIAKGSDNSPECPAGGTLPSKEPTSIGALIEQSSGIMKTVQSTIEDLRKKADTAITNIGDAAGNANGMIVSMRGDVKRIASNSAHLTGNANAIVAGIRQGQGAAGKLLTDKTVADNIQATVANAKQTTANLQEATQKANTMIADVQRNDMPNVRKTLENTSKMTGQISQAVGTLMTPGPNGENTVDTVRDTVQGANQTMSNLADDTEAIKHNFFFRGFFNRRGFYNLSQLTPDEYVNTEFIKKPRTRLWIGSAGLFTTRPDGSQQLTDVGRSIIKQQMSDLVAYLPNNPLMIEGYATGGMPDQQYLASRQRAIEVRQYLESEFHLRPKLVGIMPLGNHPPPRSGKKIWDGISIVLVVSRR